jgi:F-type H+-transporting ATPase subunit b
MTYIALATDETTDVFELDESGEAGPASSGEVGHEEQGAIGAVAGQFGVDVPHLLGQASSFLIVFLILGAFVYKPVLKILREREEKIEKAVKQADEIEIRLSAVEAEREGIVKEAKKEAQIIAELAQQSAEGRREEIVSAAKKEVERVIAKGKLQLAEEKAEMLREMRRDIVDIAMKAAAHVAQDAIDERKSKSLSEEVVRKLTQS